MTNSLEQSGEIQLWRKLQSKEFVLPGRDFDRHLLPAFIADDYRTAWLERAAPTHLRKHCVGWQHSLQHYLESATTGLASMQTGRNHTGIVEHKEVAAAQQRRQLVKTVVGHRAIDARQAKQPTAATRGGRMRCNEFWRKIEVKVGKLHSGILARNAAVCSGPQPWL
jgi:hypothetical protein